MPPGGTLEIGHGTRGVSTPIALSVPDDAPEGRDTGFLKIFASTNQMSMKISQRTNIRAPHLHSATPATAAIELAVGNHWESKQSECIWWGSEIVGDSQM